MPSFPCLAALALCLATSSASAAPGAFAGQFFSGQGDADYLRLLDTCARVFQPDPELQDVSMLYTPTWNGFVEGPTWGAWWIQNSYGPTYCALPFWTEPYTTFLQNSQDLWFTQMGDGKRAGARDWVAPDGCLCDAAAPNWIYYRQGDGNVDIHDWGMEFTAAGVVMQAEVLLINRDRAAIAHYLPLLERCANFLWSRRDPANNLFLAGPAGNLLAPSYAGYRKPDGTYDKAYLAGLSITTIAALDRLIELEKLMGREATAAELTRRRDLARQGLPALTTDEGYFIKSMDPDGTRHGVFGAPRHGYFEAVANHDAVALRVADDKQSRAICDKIASIPGLRPHDVIVTNYPSLDDMYTDPVGLWGFGTWVNGGHWTTCEARMILAYFRVGRYSDARRAMEQILRFYREFRTDNPLVDFGGAPYQPNVPINCVYDTWGAPAAMVRGLFEYLYSAEGLTLIPHIPTGISALDQHFPIRLGHKRLYLSTRGRGQVTSVLVNGEPWTRFEHDRVLLPFHEMPDRARVVVCMSGARAGSADLLPPATKPAAVPAQGDAFWDAGSFAALASGNLNPLRLGADSTEGNRFLGLMRRARIHSRELSAAEIAGLAAGPDATLSGDNGLLFDFDLSRLADGVVPNAATASPCAGLSAHVVGNLTPEDSALRFTGQGYLQVDYDAHLNLAGPYTLDAWIAPDTLPAGGARIIDHVTAGVDDGYLLDTCGGNSLRFITERGVTSYDARLAPGQWVHVAATYNPSGELHLYIGGRQVASLAATSPTAPQAVSWARIGGFHGRLVAAGLENSYEAAHARLIIQRVQAMHQRQSLLAAGSLPRLPGMSQLAADRSYVETTNRLAQGLTATVRGYEGSHDAHQRRVLALWQ
jgi:hypothetical protein